MAGVKRLLCLHGGGLDARQWSGVPARLPGFAVATPDLPGHGTRRGEHLTLDGCVAAALDALNGSAAQVVGHSFGGVVALELARRQPERVRSLLLTGTVGPLTPGQAQLTALAARLPFRPARRWPSRCGSSVCRRPSGPGSAKPSPPPWTPAGRPRWSRP